MTEDLDTSLTTRRLLVQSLRHGAGHWIAAEEAGYWIAAIEGEWDRVLLWRGRINPRTGAPYSYFGAAQVVAHNPPAFDEMVRRPKGGTPRD